MTLFLEQIPSDIKVTTLSFYKRFVIQNSNAYLPVLANNYPIQEAMENFVFSDEIKTKLMKMSKLINILYAIKLCEIAAKLYFFLLTSVSLHNFHFNFSGSKHGTVKL